jgi:hypothetical protein
MTNSFGGVFMADWLITTFDNPWSPWTHPREWDAYDNTMGYKTLQTIARISSTNVLLSDELNDKLIEQTEIEMIKANPFLYTRIRENQKPFNISIKTIQNCFET